MWSKILIRVPNVYPVINELVFYVSEAVSDIGSILCMLNMFAIRLANVVVRQSRPVFQLGRCLSSAATGSKEHIDGLVKTGQKVVVFMKGTPDAPRCGFSNAVVQILKMHGVDNFDAYNVLEDEQLRQGTVTKMTDSHHC